MSQGKQTEAAAVAPESTEPPPWLRVMLEQQAQQMQNFLSSLVPHLNVGNGISAQPTTATAHAPQSLHATSESDESSYNHYGLQEHPRHTARHSHTQHNTQTMMNLPDADGATGGRPFATELEVIHRGHEVQAPPG